MPAQSKSQQRFFGVVKAMQKGDIPKKGKAGKIAKQMTKKDVDDFASTKHKGKPEKVKREMKVKNLIKKMVREELAKMNENSDTFVNILNKFGFKKGARDWGGHQFFVHKSKNLYATYNPNGRSLVIEPKRGGKALFDSDRSNFSIRALLSYLQSPKNKFVSTEEKLKEGKYDRELIRLDNATAKEFGSWKSEVLKLSKLLPNSEKKKINKDIMTINKLVFNITKTFDKNLDEGTCGYGENGELGEEPAGPHLIKKKLKEAKETIFDVAARVMKDKQAYGYNTKKGLVTVDMQTANLLTKVFKKVNPKMKKILSDLGYKSPTQLMNTLWAVVK